MGRFVVVATIVGFVCNLIQLVLWVKGGIQVPSDPNTFWDKDVTTALLIFGSIALVLAVLSILWCFSELKSLKLSMKEFSGEQIFGYFVIGSIIWQFTFTLLTLAIRKIWGIEGGDDGIGLLIMFDIFLFNQLILVAPVGISSFFAPNGVDHEAPLAADSGKTITGRRK